MNLKLKDNPKLRLVGAITQLEYIESTGTQYINTMIKVKSTHTIETSLQGVGTYSNSGTAHVLFGGRNQGTSNNPYAEAMFIAENTLRINRGTSDISENISWGTKITYKATPTQVIVNGNTTIANTPSGELLQTYVICTIQMLGNSLNQTPYCSERIYGFKLSENNTIILNLIPCKDYNGVVCMYDTVSQNFFYNQGTGDFVAGPVVSGGDHILQKTTTLYLNNCPNIDGIGTLRKIQSAQASLPAAQKLNRVRVDIGNVSGSLGELLQFSTLAGFNDAYEPQAKPRLVGTFTINDYYTSGQLTAAQAAFDGLTIVPDQNYLIDFNELAVQVLDPEQPNYNPAVAIILNNNSKGTLVNNSVVSGGGRWFLTKSQAAAITQLHYVVANTQRSFFNNITSVTDTNNICGSGSSQTYNFVSFDELQYFTNLIALPSPSNYNEGFCFNCTKLERITLPSHIKVLPWCAFKNCTALTTIQNSGFTGLGIECFYNCQNLVLTDTDIANVTYIEPAVFAGCKKITITTINANITSISESYNRNATFGGTISIPYIHFLSETPIANVMCNFARTHVYNTFKNTSYKIYVGDGTSASHDDAILAAYQAASNWSAMVSYLDTWYNYLHPSA